MKYLFRVLAKPVRLVWAIFIVLLWLVWCLLYVVGDIVWNLKVDKDKYFLHDVNPFVKDCWLVNMKHWKPIGNDNYELSWFHWALKIK